MCQVACELLVSSDAAVSVATRQQKTRVVENGQKSIYICKTEFSLVFCHRFSGSGLYILSCYLYYFSCLLTLLLTSLATVLWTKNKTLEDTTGNIPSLKEKVKKGDRQQCFKITKQV